MTMTHLTPWSCTLNWYHSAHGSLAFLWSFYILFQSSWRSDPSTKFYTEWLK